MVYGLVVFQNSNHANSVLPNPNVVHKKKKKTNQLWSFFLIKMWFL